MGCDYYIESYLEITHIKGICYFPLKLIRGYFSEFATDQIDTDDDFSEDETNRKKGLEALRESYIQLILKPSNPKMLYQNSNWTNKVYKDKYKAYIDTLIDGSESPYKDDCRKFCDMGEKPNSYNQIVNIVKKEIRRESM